MASHYELEKDRKSVKVDWATIQKNCSELKPVNYQKVAGSLSLMSNYEEPIPLDESLRQKPTDSLRPPIIYNGEEEGFKVGYTDLQPNQLHYYENFGDIRFYQTSLPRKYQNIFQDLTPPCKGKDDSCHLSFAMESADSEIPSDGDNSPMTPRKSATATYTGQYYNLPPSLTSVSKDSQNKIKINNYENISFKLLRKTPISKTPPALINHHHEFVQDFNLEYDITHRSNQQFSENIYSICQRASASGSVLERSSQLSLTEDYEDMQSIFTRRASLHKSNSCPDLSEALCFN